MVVLTNSYGQMYYSKMLVNVKENSLFGVPFNVDIPRVIYLITATSNNEMYGERLFIK